jgi:hypothetical protein
MAAPVIKLTQRRINAEGKRFNLTRVGNSCPSYKAVADRSQLPLPVEGEKVKEPEAASRSQLISRLPLTMPESSAR